VAPMLMLLLDNYDSFTFNLAHLFGEFGPEVVVRRNDETTLDEIESLKPDWICISPGPGGPSRAGISRDVVVRFGPRTPILGVCLGMQVINEVFGGSTVRAPVPVHGKRAQVHHDGEGIFSGLPAPFMAARYHSLRVEMRSTELIPVAHCEDGVIMGIRHTWLPVHGVQFHPESFLGECGLEIASNFLHTNPDFTPPVLPFPGDPERYPRVVAGETVAVRAVPARNG